MGYFLGLGKSINRILVVFITIIMIGVSFSIINQISDWNVTAQSNPNPWISRINYDGYVDLDGTATITIWGKNMGANALGGNIHIAFPSNPDMGNLMIYDGDTPTERKIFWPGETMGGDYGKAEIEIEYPVAIGIDYNGGWQQYEEHYLSVKVTPTHLGTIPFEVKMTIEANDGTWYGDPIKDGSEEGFIDQQREFVETHWIDVGAPSSPEYGFAYYAPQTGSDDLYMGETYSIHLSGVNTDDEDLYIGVEETESSLSSVEKDENYFGIEQIKGEIAPKGEFDIEFQQRHSWDWDSKSGTITAITDPSEKAAQMLNFLNTHWPEEFPYMNAVSAVTKLAEYGLLDLSSDYQYSFVGYPTFSGTTPSLSIKIKVPQKYIELFWERAREEAMASGLIQIMIEQKRMNDQLLIQVPPPPSPPPPGLLESLGASIEGLAATIGGTATTLFLIWAFPIPPPPFTNIYESTVPYYDPFPELITTPDNSAKDLAYLYSEYRGNLAAYYISLKKHDASEDIGNIQLMELHMAQALEFANLTIANLKQIQNKIMEVLADHEYFMEQASIYGVDVDAIRGDVVYTKDFLNNETFTPTTLNVLYRNNFSFADVITVRNALLNLNNIFYKNYNTILTSFGNYWIILSDLVNSQTDQFYDSLPVNPPIVVGVDDRVVYEGEEVQFDASDSYDPDGGSIIGYEWDFTEDGNPDAFGPAPTFTWYDNDDVTITLTIIVQYEITIEGENGESITITLIKRYKTSANIIIRNVEPTASIDRAYMYVDFTLRGAGEKWHNAFWDLYETDWDQDGGTLAESTLIAHLDIERSPGDPDKQSDTVYDVYIDMEKIYYFVATYYPYEDDKPINGQLQGSNPIWIDLTFEDGSTERIHHNFNVEQSMKKDSDHWVHVEPWYIDLSPWFVEHEITFDVSSEDPGTDDETFTMDWDDATSLYIEFYPYRPSGASDPYPSPYDSNEGSYPVDIHDSYYHIYMFEDDFFPELFVMDDDGGSKNFKMDIDAIHTEHIYPVK